MAPMKLPPLGLASATPALPEGWTEHVDDDTGCAYYHNEHTDATQWDFPTLPAAAAAPGAPVDDDGSRSVDPPADEAPATPESDSPPAANRALADAGADDKPAPLKRNKDYVALANAYRVERDYRDLGATPTCVMCHAQPCYDVLFPCEHKCVCRGCMVLNDIGESRDEGKWCLCPLCCGEIKRIIPHDGAEVDTYWKWVLEIKPKLPHKFEQKFEFAGAYLRQPPDEPGGAARPASCACVVS